MSAYRPVAYSTVWYRRTTAYRPPPGGGSAAKKPVSPPPQGWWSDTTLSNGMGTCPPSRPSQPSSGGYQSRQVWFETKTERGGKSGYLPSNTSVPDTTRRCTDSQDDVRAKLHRIFMCFASLRLNCSRPGHRAPSQGSFCMAGRPCPPTRDPFCWAHF